mmetsp:Transcript_24142/g.67671  ORF Transcript_24142/g.67671 Transcript_24142/m.67671 type:complete len:239 (+) Transcript_24142:1395-2111(+)
MNRHVHQLQWWSFSAGGHSAERRMYSAGRRICSTGLRLYSTARKENDIGKLTHVDDTTNMPCMVDVGGKSVTKRTARARTDVLLPQNVGEALLQGRASAGGKKFTLQHDPDDNQTAKVVDIVGPKGPIFATAVVAGTMGVKKTSDLIPFCHPLAVENVKFSVEWLAAPGGGYRVLIDCEVSVSGKTGVEMEALAGCSIAALTVYDMCKALSHDIVLERTRLVFKSGGKSDFIREEMNE